MLHYEGMMRFRLVLLPLAAAAALSAQVAFDQKDGRIDIAIDGKPFSTFYFGPETPKPYLHPLRAPDGTVVTRGWPMENIPGELTDHDHHRSMWFSHGEVNGFDFWANEKTQTPREKKGAIVLDKIASVKVMGKGDKRGNNGRIRARFHWNAPDGATLLSEDRVMIFRAATKDRVIDFDITLTAAAGEAHFGDTKEGTFAVRVATELEEQHLRARGIPRTGRIVNAEGKATEANAWGKRSPWVDYAGSIDGKLLGIAIFDHPSNPKHPTYWHVRGYGLFAANIFGEHDFHADESRDGGITLAKGEKLRFRYRILIHNGSTAGAKVGRKYERWAAPKKN